MSFQAYLENIQAKTGRTPADFRTYAADQGWADADGLRAGVKAGTIVADLKSQFGLGHGHAMAIVALLKGAKREGDA
jgi:Domain of unknown function (DUF4287)